MSLWEAVRGFVADGGTLLLTSHHLEEVEALAHRVVVVDRGRVLESGTVEEVRGRTEVRRVRFRADSVPDDLLVEVEVLVRDGDRVELLAPDADGLVRDLVRRDVAFRDLEVATASLEEAFLALTSRR